MNNGAVGDIIMAFQHNGFIKELFAAQSHILFGMIYSQRAIRIIAHTLDAVLLLILF